MQTLTKVDLTIYKHSQVGRITHLEANADDMRLARIAGRGVHFGELLFGRHYVNWVGYLDECMSRVLLSGYAVLGN